MKKSEYKQTDCAECETEDSVSQNNKNKNPDHANSKKRINRAKGQLDAVARMIDERKYCPEIIYQIRATTNALKSLEQEILRGHMKSCVKFAFRSKDPFEIEEKINEILKLTNA